MGESILGDLAQEFAERGRHHAAGTARRWYWRQAMFVALRTVIDRLRGMPWESGNHLRLSRAGRQRHRRPAGEALLHDVRDAIRVMARSPGYAATVIATLAFAIGANVAVFSVVNSVLLRPLPYANPQDLVMVFRTTDYGDEGGVSVPDFLDWRGELASFSSYTAYRPIRETYGVRGVVEEWVGVEATPELFVTLGVQPLLGRTLQPGADDPAIGTGIVLSHRLWQRRFGTDSAVIGRQIRFEHRSLTVVGVMPPSFYFPTPAEEFWAPVEESDFLQNRGAWFFRTIGRLAPGVTLEAAATEVSAIAARIDGSPEGGTDSAGVHLERRHEVYVGDTRALFGILTGAVALVLAIACSNIANLGLTRAAVRQREFAVRAAIGAGRGRLVRQLLSESLLLALLGGSVGVGLAYAIVQGFLAMGPADLPRWQEISVDGAALGFTAVVALGSGLLFGTAPALHGSRTDLTSGLKEGARGATGGVRRNRILQVLVISQLALTAVLLVGAGLLVNSLVKLTAVRPGFDTEHTLTMEIRLTRSRYDTADKVQAFHRELSRGVNALPGVDHFGYTSHLPFSESDIKATYFVEGEVPAQEDHHSLQLEVVAERYYRAMGIPLLAGRGFDMRDEPGQPLVAIINEHMAELHWPGENPVGRRFTLDDRMREDDWITVIGVAGTIRKRRLDEAEGPLAYFYLPQFTPHFGFVSGRHGFLATRTTADPLLLARGIRSEIAALDPTALITNIKTTERLVAESVAEPRFRTVLIGAFATLALLVSLVGVYGVMAFVVAQRAQEMGVRMALGASKGTIVRHVLRRGVALIAVGVGLGLLAALGATRTLQAMLYGLTATDPLTFTGVALLLAAVALAACYVPARRASRVDPLEVLRAE